MKNDERTSTTVKLKPNLYDEFKVVSIRDRHRMTLQTFVETCVNLYVSESTFRDTINSRLANTPLLSTTGSFKLSL